jgi:hypothetical protein
MEVPTDTPSIAIHMDIGLPLGKPNILNNNPPKNVGSLSEQSCDAMENLKSTNYVKHREGPWVNNVGWTTAYDT